MKKLFTTLLFFAVFATNAYSAENKPLGKIFFTLPEDGAKVKNPVTFCFDNEGLEAVQWSKTNVEGQGHYHVLVDPKPEWDKHHKQYWPLKMIHQSQGESCYTMSYKKALSKGKHTVGGLFTRNDHSQYNPPISAAITIEVE